MLNTVERLIPYLVLLAQLLFLIVFLSVVFRLSFARLLVDKVGKHAHLVSMILLLSAVLGSLFYSEVVGYEACVLCWVQRGFIYPSFVILALTVFNSSFRAWAFKLVVPLMVLSSLVALYQAYTSLGGFSLLPCTASGGSCSKVYVNELGYLTIPAMSLTVSLGVILIAWLGKKYSNENNNS